MRGGDQAGKGKGVGFGDEEQKREKRGKESYLELTIGTGDLNL